MQHPNFEAVTSLEQIEETPSWALFFFEGEIMRIPKEHWQKSAGGSFFAAADELWRLMGVEA